MSAFPLSYPLAAPMTAQKQFARALSLAVPGLALGTVPALAFDCTALTGTVIPKSAIGLPTSGAVVASASLVIAPHNGTYCKLLGGIKPVDLTAPDIKFQVNLPEHWNGKPAYPGAASARVRNQCN